jgi:hypothetical protein
MAYTPKNFKQYSEPWAPKIYGKNSQYSTYKAAACGPSSAANAIAGIKKDDKITPYVLGEWATKKGYRVLGSGTAYTFFAAVGKEYGISIKQVAGNDYRYQTETDKALHKKTVEAALKAGNWVIVVEGPGVFTTGGHYILVYSRSGKNCKVRDSASNAANRNGSAKWADVLKSAKYFWIVEVPKTVTAPKPSTPAKTTYDFVVTTESDPVINIWKDSKGKTKTGKTLKKGATIALNTSKPTGYVKYSTGYVNSKFLTRKKFTFVVTTESDPVINIWKDSKGKTKTGNTLKKGAAVKFTTNKLSGYVKYKDGYINSKYLKLKK